jgi:hypothetical protein
MKKYNVTAIRTDNYDIEVDESIITAEYLEKWSSVFHKVETVEEYIEALAFLILRFGSGEFYEGFGKIRTYSSAGNELNFLKQGKEEYSPGITIHLINEDEDHEFEVEAV